MLGTDRLVEVPGQLLDARDGRDHRAGATSSRYALAFAQTKPSAAGFLHLHTVQRPMRRKDAEDVRDAFLADEPPEAAARQQTAPG